MALITAMTAACQGDTPNDVGVRQGALDEGLVYRSDLRQAAVLETRYVGLGEAQGLEFTLEGQTYELVAISVDEPGVNISVDEPGVNISVDEPGVGISVDEPGVSISVDEPGVNISVDEPGVNIALLEHHARMSTQNNLRNRALGFTTGAIGLDVEFDGQSASISVDEPGVNVWVAEPETDVVLATPDIATATSVRGIWLTVRRVGESSVALIGFDYPAHSDLASLDSISMRAQGDGPRGHRLQVESIHFGPDGSPEGFNIVTSESNLSDTPPPKK